MKDLIGYKKGYKYQVSYTVQVDTGIIPPIPIDSDYSSLSGDGILTIKKGFSYDGPSGPTISSPNFMAASLCHDALYEMLRLAYLPEKMGFRKKADKLLRKMCCDNGMTKIRAAWVYAGVRIGARPSSRPSHARKIIKAPAKGWRTLGETS